MTDTALAGAPRLTPSDPAYEQAVTPWNLLVRHRPAAAFRATCAQDVATAVRYARRNGLGVAAMATGHGTPAVDAGGVLVNTTAMRDVTIDPARRTATVGAGARWCDVHAASAPHGLVGVCGSSSQVGVVGYTQGGGFGWLSRRLGFASSSVRAAELVTADGQIRTVDADHHPDLLWGVAGGSGNLGIVTRLTFDLHSVGALGTAGPATVYGGNLYFTLQRAAEVAAFYAEWAPTLPREVMSALTFRWFPPAPTVPQDLRGRTMVALRACASGPTPATGPELVQIARSALGVPVADTFATLPGHDLDPISADPRMPVPAAQHGEALRDLDTDVIDILVEETVPTDGPPLVMLELRQLGGAMNHAPRGPHPMARTDAAYTVNTISLVPTPIDEATARARHRRLFDRLSPHLTGTTYLNFLEGGTPPSRVRAAYDDADWARLVDLKTTYDPHNTFRFNRTVPPLDTTDPTTTPNTHSNGDPS